MSENKQLNEQDLQKVSGGSGLGYASAEHLPADHGRHISEWEAIDYKRKEVYIVNDEYNDKWGYGTLTNSVFVENPLKNYYDHTILIKDFHNSVNYFSGKISTFCSAGWTLYEKNN